MSKVHCWDRNFPGWVVQTSLFSLPSDQYICLIKLWQPPSNFTEKNVVLVNNPPQKRTSPTPYTIFAEFILKGGGLKCWIVHVVYLLVFFLRAYWIDSLASWGQPLVGYFELCLQQPEGLSRRWKATFFWEKTKWMFPKIGNPPIIHFNWVFHYKPSILGYPYFWKHPNTLPETNSKSTWK